MSWYMDSDDKLTHDDLPESIEGGIFQPPYPASFWYYDEAKGRLNMLLIPEPPISPSIYAGNQKVKKIYVGEELINSEYIGDILLELSDM